MARAMVHPMWGNLVQCAEVRDMRHFVGNPRHIGRREFCEVCGAMMWACEDCQSLTQCCTCGEYHARECPWPL